MGDLQPVFDFLVKMGLTPLEVITLIAVVVLYRDNRMLLDKVTKVQADLEDCVKKVVPVAPVN